MLSPGRIGPLQLNAITWFGNLTINHVSRFLPRDDMHKRGLCRRAVSVSPPVTFVDSVETNKQIFNFFFTVG